METPEEWRDAISSRFGELVSDLQVSNLGNIRKKGTGFVFKTKDHKDGYPCIKRKKKTIYRHTLVAESFLGVRTEGMVIDHIDNDKENNCLSNLRWVTNKVNTQKGDRLETPEGNFVEHPTKTPRHYKENLIRSQVSLKDDIKKLEDKVTMLEKVLYESNAVIAYLYQTRQVSVETP